MTEPGRSAWRATVVAGLLWGAAAVFLSLVGLVEAVSQRQVIVGVASLGHTVLILLGWAAGYHVGRVQGREPWTSILLRGIVAGGVVGACVSVLIAVGTAIPIRNVIVSASPVLFNVLSFGRGRDGMPLVTAVGVLLGVVGAGTQLIPAGPRRALLGALAAALTVGVFQEIFQLMLQSGVRAAVRDVLFTYEGLTVRGVVIVFAVAATITLGWNWRRDRVQGWIAALPPAPRRLLRVITLLAAVAALLLFPFAAGSFLSQVLVIVGYYTLMGLGLNLEVGFAGLLDLGFVAFFAIGAYTVGLLTTTGPLAIAHLSWWTAVPIAVVVTLLSGVIFGLPILRIRGDYLAIATLGFGEIIRLLALSDWLRPWFGGSQGLLGIPKPFLGSFELRRPEHVFYLTVLGSALVAFVAARLRDSRLGRAWMAIREDEDVAEALGVNTVNVKLLAYGIGAAFAGVGGAIFAVVVSSVFPHSFSVLISINVLSLIIVGGMGSLPGVIVGSFVLVGLPELLREFSDFRFLVYGAVLIVMMQFRPEGLWPTTVARRELHEDVAETPLSQPAEAPGGAAGSEG